jgi:DNA polymerase-1
MFIADPGNVICSADYSQVELRVLAVLANEKAMKEAILGGVDLHDLTAERAGIPRKVAKMTNFLIVYGGGASKLARSANIPESEAKAAVRGFHKAYPAVKRFSNRLQDRSGHGARPVVTPAGRWLPLDRDKTYAALNYLIQSTARDLLAEALVELNETYGVSEGLLLPVHDEVVFQAPTDAALHIASEVGSIMSTELDGIPIDAEGEVYGPSWGHGYDTDTVPAELKEFFS